MPVSIGPIFFESTSAFRKWLKKNHLKEKELIVGYYKVKTGKPSMAWSESVDQALCFGWIDGIRRTVDDESYCIRFTPRSNNSVWSAINIQKVQELTKLGLMQPVGLEIFNARKENSTGIYSYENQHIVFPKEIEKIFKANKKAWQYFQTCPPSYKKTVIRWVMTAKQEATRISRLHRLIANSEAGKR